MWWLNAGRGAVLGGVLCCCLSASAASAQQGASAAALVNKVRTRAPSVVFTVAEPPSFMLLALGLIGISLHGIARASRQ